LGLLDLDQSAAKWLSSAVLKIMWSPSGLVTPTATSAWKSDTAVYFAAPFAAATLFSGFGLFDLPSVCLVEELSADLE